MIQLDEEVEGMQSTIQVLQQQLAAVKRQCERNKDLIRQYEHAIQMKQERERAEYAERSVSENEGSTDSENEYEANPQRLPQSPQSSSVEEGEYSSTSETAYVHDDVSVTGYISDQIDAYEILETLPDDDDEKDGPDRERSAPRTPTQEPDD